MAENSKIAWTDHTFNPWRGCQKVAAGCVNCYAESQSKRNPGVLGIWGPNGTRVIASESMWREPLKWDRKAGEACHRHRVFCASLADVFEDWSGPICDALGDYIYCDLDGSNWEGMVYHPDEAEDQLDPRRTRPLRLGDVRSRLFKLIDATPNLDWLLLTKRPENIAGMWGENVWGGGRAKRANVWLGTSVAEQADADRNIPLLLKCRDLAPVLFISAEPLIGPVDFTLSGATIGDWDEDWKYNVLSGHEFSSPRDDSEPKSEKIDWVIVGGESGHHARACNVAWIRSIVDQCHDAGCPCFVKQLGSNAISVVRRGEDVDGGAVPMVSRETQIKLNDSKGGDISEFPLHLQVRKFPQ